MSLPMAKASDMITTERELDERLRELEERRRIRGEKERRREIQFDIIVVAFAVLLILAYASLPILPDDWAQRVGHYIDGSWTVLPLVFVGLALSRLVTYALTRHYPDV